MARQNQLHKPHFQVSPFQPAMRTDVHSGTVPWPYVPDVPGYDQPGPVGRGYRSGLWRMLMWAIGSSHIYTGLQDVANTNWGPVYADIQYVRPYGSPPVVRQPAWSDSVGFPGTGNPVEGSL